VNAIAAGVRPLDEKLLTSKRSTGASGCHACSGSRPTRGRRPWIAALAAAVFLPRGIARDVDRAAESFGPATQVGRFKTLRRARVRRSVARLRGSPPTQAAAERLRIAHLVLPALYIAVQVDDQPAASGCVVIDDDVAGIFNMVTTPAQTRFRATRQRSSSTCCGMRALPARRWAYLQVDAANAAARCVLPQVRFP